MFDKGTRWIESCTADGWEKETPYCGSSTVRLTRDGYIVIVGEDHLGDGPIFGYGPDKLCLELPDEYNWGAIQAAVTHCSECPYIGPTVRLGFAKRVCKECRVRLIDKYEYPGWCN